MLSYNCGSVGKKGGSFPDATRTVSTRTTVLYQIVTVQLLRNVGTIVGTVGSAGTITLRAIWR
jgi:hypothetical protein